MMKMMHDHNTVDMMMLMVFAEVPQEPSYLIINTAISTSWGFPNPPWGCAGYDCKDPELQCGFNAGFCKSLPAEFLVNYMRVYQVAFAVFYVHEHTLALTRSHTLTHANNHSHAHTHYTYETFVKMTLEEEYVYV